MSIVYLAINERANKQWAVKEVRKDGICDFEVVKQGLVGETDILKKLSHPHLPSIIDIIDGDGTFLIVMDYINGEPLDRILNVHGAQSQENVAMWGRQLCDVLGYLHSRPSPIIYRDMKPANVRIKLDGNVTLIDFGTAREYKELNIEDTTCLGTQGYAAPEQYGGHGQTDARTDIYCLGATLYHLVTGQNPSLPPYEIYPIRKWNPKLSSGLEKIILKCTQRNPDERYQSCAELMYELEHYKELEESYIKIQNRKWWGFVLSLSIAIIAFLGAFGFKAAEMCNVKKSYDFYIKQAELSDLAEAEVYYIKAMNLAPSKDAAYTEYLEKIILKDNIFTSAENQQMRRVFNENNGSSRSNIDNLRVHNRAGYDRLAMALGNAYYYCYEGGEGKSKSSVWYADASVSKFLSDGQIQRAELLGKIGNYYAELSVKKISGDSNVSYLTYWENLTTATNSGNIAQEDNVVTALRMYKELVIQIYMNTEKFKKEGITQIDMYEELETVKKHLDTDITIGDEDIIGEKNSILMVVEKAKKQVDAVYH